MKVAIQMNDTHPALTVAELMRVFIDEERMAWEEAWAITVATCGYTNHTLLPEALERWSYELVRRVLPRHLQIIQEINRRLLAEVEHRFPGEIRMQQNVAIVANGEVRMANLAMAGSHSINGVAALHSELVKTHARARFPSPLSAALQQQDERRHAAALAAAREPSAGVADHEDDRSTTG